MINRIRFWLQKKLGIIELQQQLVQHENLVKQITNELQKYTRVDADVGFRGNNTIILTGVYRGQAYVQFYDLGKVEFAELVNQLKSMKSYALIRNMDAPIAFKQAFKL